MEKKRLHWIKTEKDFIDLTVFSSIEKMKIQQCSVYKEVRRSKVSMIDEISKDYRVRQFIVIGLNPIFRMERITVFFSSLLLKMPSARCFH